jgi:hypothetical protein
VGAAVAAAEVAVIRWLGALAILAACGGTPKVDKRPIERTPAVSVDGAPDAHTAAVAEAEAAWVERADEARLRAAIAAWKRAVESRDSDVASYLALARAHFTLADGHLFLDPGKADDRRRAYEEGAAFAERGLRALSPEFERRRSAGASVEDAAKDLGAEAAPLLYWWAIDLIRWADLDGWTTAAGVYKEVFRVMERVRQLDPTVDHAGPDRFFGAARAEAPAIAGGSLTESRAFFDRALAAEPDYLETHYMLARTLAKRSNDKTLFDATLQKIASTAASAVPDALPEQSFAKQKAAALTW